MKTIKLPLAVSLVGLCLSFQLNAADSPDTRPSKEEIRQQLLRYDVDQNGYLDAKERQALLHDSAIKQEAKRAAQVEAARAAGALTAKTNGITPEILIRYDANGNGLMDPSEWKNYRRDQMRLRAGKPVSGQATNVVTAPKQPQP